MCGVRDVPLQQNCHDMLRDGKLKLSFCRNRHGAWCYFTKLNTLLGDSSNDLSKSRRKYTNMYKHIVCIIIKIKAKNVSVSLEKRNNYCFARHLR